MLLLIDNYDSFSFNLYQLIGELEPDIKVIRNDEMTVDEILKLNPSGIIISPGPGRPENAGVIVDLIRTLGRVEETKQQNAFDADADDPDDGSTTMYLRDAGIYKDAAAAYTADAQDAPHCIPTIGVCLGHQAICMAFGGTITYASRLMHGKQSLTRFDKSSVLFKDVPDEALVARYHSLALDEKTLPEALRITARTVEGDVMAVEHKQLPIYGMQFHPESIMTKDGRTILKAFIEKTRE